MIKNMETDDIELLNIIIYEEDLGISKNLYTKKKIKFLIEHIGKKKCLELLTPPYNDLFMYLLDHNYNVDNGGLSTLGCGEWKVKNYTRSLKKVQKHLELYFLEYIYPKADIKVKDKYIEIFEHHTKELGLQNTINDIYNNKCKTNEGNKLYNQDVKYLEKYFEENPDTPVTMDDVKTELEKIIKGLVSTEMTNRLVTHRNNIVFNMNEIVNLKIEIKELEKKLEELKELEEVSTKKKKKTDKIVELGGDIKKKKNKIESNSESCFSNYKMLTKLPARTILSKADLDAFRTHTELYYNNLVDQLNYIYGYDRYIK